MVIFDCNGVLVDSEPIAVTVAAQQFALAGIPVTPEIIARYFFGRRPSDMLAAVEAATHCKLPDDFAAKARGLEQAALAFQTATQGNDVAAIRAAQGNLGKSCKACHDLYREKDD